MGWSKHNPHDKYNRHVGLVKAIDAGFIVNQGEWDNVPKSMRATINWVLDRAGFYFKQFKQLEETSAG